MALIKKVNIMKRNDLKEIREDINKALAEVGEKHGIQFEFNNIRFDSNSFRTTLKAYEVGENADDDAAARVKFEKHAHKFGLNKSDFGSKFGFRGKTYKVCGIKPKARKYPVVAELESTGKRYAFPAETIK